MVCNIAFARLSHPETIIDHDGNFCVGLSGSADAKLSVTGDISGQISSGNITLFEAGIPGLNIPKYVIADLETSSNE